MGGGRFLFVTWWGGGNVNPMLALGCRLVHRGHHVRVLGPANLVDRFAAERMTLRPRVNEWASDTLAREVLAEIAREPTDALLIDFMMPEALCAAERSALPTIAFVHTLLQPEIDGEVDFMGAFSPLGSVNATRADLELAPLERIVELLDRSDMVLAALPAALDKPAALHPATMPGANVYYAGALVEDDGADAGWSPPWTENRELPLVVVSMGTTPMDEQPTIQRVLDALRDLPVHAFVTVGTHADVNAFDVPANAVVTGAVRHAAVFPQARVFVTHAGLGGVVAAVHFGVPMVCVPLGRDQPLNAVRVADLGVGRDVGRDATVEELRAAMLDVLEQPSYRSAAQRLRERTAREHPPDDVVRRIEQLLPDR